jgi:hypothetical protein
MSWLLEPGPVARVAWLRVLAYAFVPVDVLLTTPWVAAHAHVPAALYRPLALERLLHLPAPGPWVQVLRWLLVLGALAAAGAAARDRLPAPAGWLLAVAYLDWMLVAFSYGKVDHDRFAFLVLLFVLPTAGRAGLRERGSSPEAGWVLRVTALAVVATYTLSALAKVRFGGWDWVDGATITRAVVRRGNPLATPLLAHPWTLHATQYVLFGVELLVAPLLLVRWRRPALTVLLVVGFLGFHLMTFVMISIVFLPHCVALLSLLPLERLPALLRRADRAPVGVAG